MIEASLFVYYKSPSLPHFATFLLTPCRNFLVRLHKREHDGPPFIPSVVPPRMQATYHVNASRTVQVSSALQIRCGFNPPSLDLCKRHSRPCTVDASIVYCPECRSARSRTVVPTTVRGIEGAVWVTSTALVRGWDRRHGGVSFAPHADKRHWCSNIRGTSVEPVMG